MKRLGRKTLAAFGTAAFEDFEVVFETMEETVFAGSFSFFGLISSLRHGGILTSR